jgi:hypothetical protein
MLDKVSVSLVEFKIYEEIEDGKYKIDGALNTAVHKIMIGFIDVCALRSLSKMVAGSQSNGYDEDGRSQ